MSIISEFLPLIFSVLVIAGVFFTVFYILKSLSDKINNAELYREESLSVLEEIRDELKELNKKNSLK
ncbi:hypothetical protein K5V07_05850 [Flavobacterium sp. CHNK8]|uniref:hypothetical protein n=1 Tax=unclassified Flavobacterium TaxID=196869 RepID=UPI001C8D7E7B|nr:MULTISPECIES: hypothetical protein [unclassified Flavobacterium]QZK90037.1 hypothetical protein K5V07_05850 [Flavobacterium sp. CHNK8]CAH0335423.1 hypothetical protein FVB9288_01065 [Flavobacterium sp. CECT 9288]